ncbi:MAG: calcium/sodium antiporter [Firmicutes bacterium]|nr:calcium/sodium antiporter [Bacillota bacterium]
MPDCLSVILPASAGAEFFLFKGPMLYVTLIAGFFFLIKGADVLVEGASDIAKRFGIPSLVIGLTIVAFGTHVPELVIGLLSASRGSTDIALGNAIGSNIFNILFIAGITSVLVPLHVSHTTVWKEIPYGLLAAVVLYIIANDYTYNFHHEPWITRGDGLIMLCFFVIFMIYIFELAIKFREEIHDKSEETNEVKAKQHPMWKVVVMIVCGILGLVIGGELVVEGAVSVARKMGVSEYLISATVIAGGTGLPELAACISAALKKEHDISIGNIVGSNVFNIFLALGVTSVYKPMKVPVGINYDIVFLMIISLFLFFFMFTGEKKETKYKLHRLEGVFLLLLYAGYLTYIIMRG